MIIVEIRVRKARESDNKDDAVVIVKRNPMRHGNRTNEIRLKPGEQWECVLEYPATLTIHDTLVRR